MKVLQHPSVRLLAVAVGIGIAIRQIFFALSEWLWRFDVPVLDADVVPWARWTIHERDGAEPYALLALTLLQLLATGLGFLLVGRAAPRWRAALVALLLVAVGLFAYLLPPRPPLYAVEADFTHALMVVAASLLIALLFARSVRPDIRIPALPAVILLPLCFIPTKLPSLFDLGCILAPAVRLAHGISPRAMYLQYDLFPSLLAAAWGAIVSDPTSFSFVCAASYYAMLLGMLLIVTRMFKRPQLAGPLVVAILLARMYGSTVDASAVPQVTPLRLDLWPLVLAGVLAGGLRRWPVGLVLGLLYFFSRSMGILYLAAWALALAGDFLADRFATPAGERPPVRAALRLALVELKPSLGLIALSLVAALAVSGHLGADGLSLYGHLGPGMLRIGRDSFYWWLLPLLGMAGWLAFSQRRSLPPRRAQAALMAVPLLVVNAIYFFGRSAEQNLINLGSSFLFGLFLVLDLSWPPSTSPSSTSPSSTSPSSAAPSSAASPNSDTDTDTDPAVIRWFFRLAPYLVVVVCAYSYSARVVAKFDVQQAVAISHSPLGGEAVPTINCNEVKQAAGDSRIFFLSMSDYWLYQQCGLIPRGRVQPVYLNILKATLLDDIRKLLAAGFKIVVPRNPNDACAAYWPELQPQLVHTDVTTTPNFNIYRQNTQAPN